MPLVLVRVDCRLIHGQVVETWVPHTGANCLLVVNDDLVGNPFLRSVMEMAVPQAIHVAFCRLADVDRVMADVDRQGERAIVLCATSADALDLYRRGLRFSNLNIGNLHYAKGKVEVAPSVYFGREDFEAVHCLSHLGVAVTVKATPFEAGTSFDPEG